jgi:radical SAM protein with 4Fe4S-binding SPASM domain
MTKKHFCTAPWVHIHTWPNGTVFPCRNSLREFDNVGNLYDNTIEEIWNSDKIKQFRQDLLNDVARPDICGRCYENEAVGHWSLRQYCNENFKEEFEIQSQFDDVPPNLYYWDFRFDNTCNQACRSCGPQLSSSWHDDYYRKTGRNPIGIESKFTKFRKDDVNRKLIDDNLSYVKEINFAGGESTITQDHYEILNKLFAMNKLNVSLRYVTNLSTLKYKDMKFLEVWPRMKRVDVVVSLDEVESRGEYWRHGLKWPEFVDNCKTLLATCHANQNMSMSYGVTVSIFNLLRLNDIADYLLEHGMLDSSVFIDYNSALNCTSHLDITSLPDHIKQQAIKNIDLLIEKLERLGIKSSIESVKNKIQENYVISESTLKYAAESFAKLDVIRNQSLKEVAPELYEIYKDYGYEEVATTFVPFELPK